MKNTLTACLLLLFLQCFSLPVFAQTRSVYQIDFRSGAVVPNDKIDEAMINQLNETIANSNAIAVIQFNELPVQSKAAVLQNEGIQLLNFLGGRAYIVSISKALSPSKLKSIGIRAVLEIQPQQKIHPALLLANTSQTVLVSLFPIISSTEALAGLQAKGFSAKIVYDAYPVLQLDVPAGRLQELASFSFIESIEPKPLPLVELNNKSEAGTRANVLQSSTYGLTGEGVTFQINELTGYPQGHIDFIDRSITGLTQDAPNYHCTHVHGIAAGAGLINELYKGYAPKARFFSGNNLTGNVPANVVNYDVSLTNNSYGAGTGCSSPANVNSINSFVIDKQAIDFGSLLNIFAAGNIGATQCPLYPLGYNTIDVNNQTAKSVITVGATTTDGVLADFSSKGPVKGGRIKPEIVAPGVQIWSTVPDHNYGINNGTSMAAPAVMGALGLLYQRYMQLHSGTKPSNALMKALLCNTATDKGPVGPDYGYGFGFMNLNRALQTLNAQHFYSDSASLGETKTKTIIIPNGVAQLKLMLYWMDKPATPLTNKLIINDLDLTVITPSGATVLPYVLDTVPSLVANPAHRGADHINNVEQVVIDNPIAGTYTINVNGYELGEGEKQNYYVVYDLVPDSIQVTYPAAGQSFPPGEAIKLQWDSWGNVSSSYKLEFSADNGMNWQLINSAVPANSSTYDWAAPSVLTNQALIRLIRNADNKVSVSGAFQILGVPSLQLSVYQCPGSIAMQWMPVSGATDYEVMWYRNGDMVRAALTNQTAYIFQNLSEDSTYWVTVRARYNAQAGRRAVALSRKPDDGNCTDAVHNGDLKMNALLSPLFGRKFTSEQLSVEHLRVQIKNLDDEPSSGFTVGYSVNGGSWTNETVTSPIAANGSLVYQFTSGYDLSLTGNYAVKISVHSNNDPNPGNDTATYIIRHVPNDPIHLTAGIVTDLEDAPVKDYTGSAKGLDGLDRFDYKSISPLEVLRIGSHYLSNTTRTFEMVNNAVTPTALQHSLIATYNLSQFDTAQHSLAMDFSFYGPSTAGNTFDSLLVRGSDTDDWILMGNIATAPSNALRPFQEIAVGDSLKAHAQNYSSSFQVKWTPSFSTGPMLLDNIRLYNSGKDLSIVSIDSLAPYSCALSATTPIYATIRNKSKQPFTNVPIHFRIDGGSIVSEIISQLPAQSTVAFRFSQRADLSSLGQHTIEIWTDDPQDSYSANNAQKLILRNQALVKTFPQVEDFENNNGGWYTDGTNTSWAWGTPTSTKIKGAASGTHAWKTNLTGSYNPNEVSNLYTGCYDLTSLVKPMISLSAALNTDSCNNILCGDNVTFQYSVNGRDWRTLLPATFYNWPLQITSFYYNRWHVMSQRLPDTLKTVQFRFQLRSDGYNSFDGMAVDDFHVYDSAGRIYTGASVDLQQAVGSTANWIEYRKDGRLIAAINSHGQDLGTVTIKTFTNTNSVRHFHGQYYADRNFVISASHPITDSISLRFYVTDKEMDSLLFAKSCAGCTKPSNAYRFGVSAYQSSLPVEMDSAISNDQKGAWSFIANNRIKTVPFGEGYYLEFKTKEWGEFRLNNGGLDGLSPLPVQIRAFTALKNASLVQLQWTTLSEINIHHFDVEVAKGNAAFQQGQFEKTGEVLSGGKSSLPQNYNFTDNAANKKGAYYYRLKAIDSYGNYMYTESVPLLFSEDLEWNIYPNPSEGKFNLTYQAAAGTNLEATVYNAIGSVVKMQSFGANGFVQSQEINLSNFTAGIYYLQIITGTDVRRIKLIKQ